MTELLTISEVRRRTQNGFVTARVHAQVESAAARATREGKPYCEISLADACDRMMLRVWDNHPDYKSCSALQDGDFIEIDGEFAQHQQFGLEAKTWKSRNLTSDEIANLLAGPAELRAKQAADSAFITQTLAGVESLSDRPRRNATSVPLGEREGRSSAMVVKVIGMAGPPSALTAYRSPLIPLPPTKIANDSWPTSIFPRSGGIVPQDQRDRSEPMRKSAGRTRG